MSDIPVEYFLPLPQANAEREIIDDRHLPVEVAQNLYSLQISEEQLKSFREKFLHKMKLLHGQALKKPKKAKQQAQARLRKARSRQATYPDNVEAKQKDRDIFVTRSRLRHQAYENQEQQVQYWVPPYYKNGRFDVKALGQTIHSDLPGLIPSFVEEVGWNDQNGTFASLPPTPKLKKEKLKQDEDFRDFVRELYIAFLSWCPPQNKEAKAYAMILSPLQLAWRVRYNTQATNFILAIINHIVPNIRYTSSDLHYVLKLEKLTKKQRNAAATSEQSSPIPSNTPSEDISEIRRKVYEAAFFDPYQFG